jgi:tetratricopeptide (TPR) repeat protein
MKLISTKTIKIFSKDTFIKTELGLSTLATTLILVVVATSSVLLINWSKPELREENQKASQIEHPPLYLPSAKYIKFVTLGFDNFFSDVLWFNTINYFGKQLKGNRDYQWLNQMCDLVTELDPKKKYAYEFCSTMLSWETKDFEASNKILTHGIENNPDYWRFWYLRGFNYWYFFDDREKAIRDMTRASQIPDAPPFVAALAASLIADSNDIENAIRFLEDMIGNSTDDNAKNALIEKLKRAYISRDIKYIENVISKYEETHDEKITDLRKLVSLGIKIPLDPYGKEYYVDKDTGEVKTNSNVEGLKFKGKTKDTGIFADENRKSKKKSEPIENKENVPGGESHKDIENQGQQP